MKKLLSVLLAVVLLTAACLPAVHAAEASNTESVWRIKWHDPTIYYMRFDEDVTAAADALRVEYTTKEQDAPALLDTESISLYTTDDGKAELILRFSEFVPDFTVSGLVLQDGTHISQTVQTENVPEIDWTGLDRTYLLKKHDALYLPHLIQGDSGCDVAVGSRWELRFNALTYPHDPYLQTRLTLEADGIELRRDGDEYIFDDVGQGEVYLCLFGIPCSIGYDVHVMEKSSLKTRILLTAPFQYAALPIYGLRYLGPFTVLLLPAAFVYALVTYVRLLIA